MHYRILFRASCTDRQDKRKEWKENEEENQGGKGKNGSKRETKEGQRKMYYVTNCVGHFECHFISSSHHPFKVNTTEPILQIKKLRLGDIE